MTRASTYTLLSIDRYAKMLGIPPVHFSGGIIGGSLNLFPYRGTCSDMWVQHSWQGADVVSREDLAEAIRQAEIEIAEQVGYFPAPLWIVDEPHQYTRYHRPDEIGNGTDIYGRYKSITLDYGRFIQAGLRKVTLIGTALYEDDPGDTLTYTDLDGDGFWETATLVLPVAATVTDERELKAYYPGHAGEPEWEIRPCRTKVISGGFVTMTFWTWQFVEPSLYEFFPTDVNYPVVDLLDDRNLLASVDVYQETTDTTSHGAMFYWEPDPQSVNTLANCCTVCGGGGCEACTHTTQDGCLFVRDIPNGIAVPRPADYDVTNEVWSVTNWTKCREPDIVKVYYKAGDLSQDYLSRHTSEPLSDFWAWTIAYLATARLERRFCTCGNLTALQEELRTDLSMSVTGTSRFVTPDVVNSPFGTRKGEVMAWKRVLKFAKKRAKVAVI